MPPQPFDDARLVSPCFGFGARHAGVVLGNDRSFLEKRPPVLWCPRGFPVLQEGHDLGLMQPKLRDELVRQRKPPNACCSSLLKKRRLKSL